jgi:hypothetical protein
LLLIRRYQSFLGVASDQAVLEEILVEDACVDDRGGDAILDGTTPAPLEETDDGTEMFILFVVLVPGRGEVGGDEGYEVRRLGEGVGEGGFEGDGGDCD